MSTQTSGRLQLPAGRAVTLKDVAARAGVGAMSASAVLNGGGGGSRYVSEEARQRIEVAARELGYRRNGSAATIRKGRFGAVALLLSTEELRSYITPALLAALHDELASRDTHLVLARIPDRDLVNTDFVPKILRELMVDGLIINYIESIPPHMVAMVKEQRLPAVWLNSLQPWDCVHPDDEEAGYRATSHLANLGHRRIAYLDYVHAFRPDTEIHYSAHDRLRGYERAMSERGLPSHIVRGAQAAVPAKERVAHARALLSSGQRPTAVVTYATEVQPLYIAALQLGLDVPADLSMITFGAMELDPAHVPCGVLLEPLREVGQAAVQMLWEKIEEPTRDLLPRPLPFALRPGPVCPPSSV